MIKLVHEVEETDAEHLYDFITTPLQDEEPMNVTFDNNEDLSTTSMLQVYENICNVSQLSCCITIEKSQIIDKIDMIRITIILIMNKDNGSIESWTYSKSMANDQFLWYNLLPCQTNDWQWFRAFAVP